MGSSNFISAAVLDISRKATAVKERAEFSLLVHCIPVHKIHVSPAASIRPFLTRKFFQEILGLEGSKISWEKKTFLTRKFSGKNSSPKISLGNFGSNSPSRGNFIAQNFLETRGNFTRKFLDHLIIELKSVPFPSTG